MAESTDRAKSPNASEADFAPDPICSNIVVKAFSTSPLMRVATSSATVLRPATSTLSRATRLMASSDPVAVASACIFGIIPSTSVAVC
jgi:hypothetical protein